MNKTLIAAVLLAALLGLVAGHWLSSVQDIQGKAPAQPLYYRHPMNPSVTSPVPAKNEMGMDYLPIYAEEQAPVKPERKILYYRNPMGLPDTSPAPKKDNMGMDYLPVYADEATAAGLVTLSPEKIQKLGVRSEVVERRVLSHTVRAVGTVQVDERRIVVVAPRFEGWIDKLYVNATGQAVRKGQPLMDVYSPELLASVEEYRIAQGAGERLEEAARRRLRNFGVGEGFLSRLSQPRSPDRQPSPPSPLQNPHPTLSQRERGFRDWGEGGEPNPAIPGRPVRSVPLSAPAGGVVLEKNAVAGMRFGAGEVLYRIADLSSVWLLADIFEQDLAYIHEGHAASLKVNAYPARTFSGKVAFIYPTVTAQTRTAKLRVELPNPDGLLKPAMYGSVELLAHPAHEPVLAVSDSAVIDSGIRQIVLVQRGEGTFAPRSVRLGKRGEGYAEVLEGLAEGETVVTQANFLIDAESNLKAALGGFGGQEQSQSTAQEGGEGVKP